MTHYLARAVCNAALLTTLAFAASANAQATPAHERTGPYLGVAYGAAFGDREIDDPNHTSDERVGRGLRLVGGYQLNEHFGVQVGYVRMRGLNQDTGAGAALVTRSAVGQSIYAASTARLPLGQSFALTGKLGLSIGRVTSVDPSTAASDGLVGSKTSLLFGTGAEYVFDDRLSFSIELESYGRISDRVKGSALMLGTRINF